VVESSIGPYRILERLGSGGMGDVFLAEDTRLHRKVALKTLAGSWSKSPDARERLLREARAAAGLNHPNIAAIYDVVEAGDVLHIVMEYVEGEPLFARLGSGGLPPDEVTSIAIQLCDAMEVAHGQGVIHRDLKPGNILLTREGRIKVLDFGLAKTVPSGGGPPVLPSDSTPSNPGHIQGTPAYMSPEQLRGQTVDHRTDIYSLGVLLYELLTGHRPFHGTGVMELGMAVLTQPTPSSAQVDPHIPAGLSAIVARAMAREREERFQSVADMRDALRRLPPGVSDRTTVSALFPWVVKTVAGRRRFRWDRISWTLGVLALLAVGLSVSGRAPWVTPSSAFADRDWLLVADIDNTSGEAVFDGVLREGLIAALEQSSYVNIVPPDRVAQALARMRRDKATRMDLGVGREICQREGIKALLLGTIRRSGDTFQVRVQVLEAATGRAFFSDKEQFSSRDELFPRMDALSARVRARLGEPLSRIAKANKPLAQVTTRSIEALQLYSRAREAIARGDVLAARGLLQKAVELDGEFALAHMELGHVAVALGDGDEANRQFGLAHDLHEFATERESHLIAANYHRTRGEFDEAARELRAMVSLYPDDADAHRELAVAYDATGELSRAIPELREALRLDPFDALSVSNLGLFEATTSAFGDAEKTLTGAALRGLRYAGFGWGLGIAKLGLGRVDEALAAFREMAEAGPPHEAIGQLYLARTAVYRGRMSEAKELLARPLPSAQKVGFVSFEAPRRRVLARILRCEGRDAESRREAEALVLDPGDPDAETLRDAGSLLAELKDMGSAKRALDRLRKGTARTNSLFDKSCVHNLEGEIALAEARLPDALAAFLEGAAEYPQHDSALGLARTYEAQGDWPRAAEAWRKILAAQGEILRFGFPADWALAHSAVARVERRLGNEPSAQEHHATYAALWKDADDFPMRRRIDREWAAGAATQTGNRTMKSN
jgi:tetratricopeptide (TPR) repeat protein